MKLATSGGSRWISLSLRPSFRKFKSRKKGCGQNDRVSSLYSQRPEGIEDFLNQEHHGHRFLDLCVSQVTQGSGGLAMIPSVLKTRQRSLQDTLLPS